MISKEDVQHIAQLARIQLTEQETEQFQSDLSEVLDYFETLKGVDVAHVAPMTHSIAHQNITRLDIAAIDDPNTAKRLQSAAPDTQEGYVKVKSVF